MTLTLNLLGCAAIAVLLPLSSAAQEVPKEGEQLAEETGAVPVISCPELRKKVANKTLTTEEMPLLKACFSDTPLVPYIGPGTVTAVIPDLPGRGDPYGLSTFGLPINGMVDG